MRCPAVGSNDPVCPHRRQTALLGTAYRNRAPPFYPVRLGQTTRHTPYGGRPRCSSLPSSAIHHRCYQHNAFHLGQTTRHALNESRPRCLALISASVQCPFILNFAVGSNDPDSPPRWTVRVAWNHSPLLCASWLITWVKRPGLYPSGTGRVACLCPFPLLSASPCTLSDDSEANVSGRNAPVNTHCDITARCQR